MYKESDDFNDKVDNRYDLKRKMNEFPKTIYFLQI